MAEISVWAMEDYFKRVGAGKSAKIGAAIGAVFAIVAVLTQSGAVGAAGLLVFGLGYGWLILTLQLVAFSKGFRTELLGPDLYWIEAIFIRLFSPYTAFCLSGLVVIVASMASWAGYLAWVNGAGV